MRYEDMTVHQQRDWALTQLRSAQATIGQLNNMINRLTDERDAAREQIGAHIDSIFYDTIRQQYKLTPKHAGVLILLHNARGRPVSKSFLNDNLSSNSLDRHNIADDVIDVHICHLRAKIGKDAITTEWGRGFALAPEWVAALDILRDGLSQRLEAAE